ncbi:MAG: biopolymer transporter ExbD [Spirochaetales bacterium]|jgi:biopolymer transport protein ExbD|nr:biopolymer transporter ExbD [Spirochaetales bacterium]
MRLDRRLKPQISLDLTPLIDVVFQLVIFFMISTTFNTAPGIELNLPESATAVSVKVDQVRITFVSPDEIYLNEDLHSIASLEEELDNLAPILRDQEKPVIVEGDSEAPYQLLIQILDMLRARDIAAANLITLPPE